jgi:hypothetical protein
MLGFQLLNRGLTVKTFSNVEVYGMMMRVLGLSPEPN